MRTTVDIDKDVLDRLKRMADAESIPFKHLLNRLLREGLKRPLVRQPPYKGPSFSMGPFLVRPELASDYLDDLGDRAEVERRTSRKDKRA